MRGVLSVGQGHLENLGLTSVGAREPVVHAVAVILAGAVAGSMARLHRLSLEEG